MTATKVPLTIIIIAVALAGCGVADPYTHPIPRHPIGPHAQRDVDSSDISARRPGTSLALREPRAVVRRFATLWANWNWMTIARIRTLCAQLAVPPLRQRLLADATQARTDPSLRRERITSAGGVVAIALGHGDPFRTAVVVVRETQASFGRAALGDMAVAAYRLRLVRIGAQWLVRDWEPVE